MVEITLDKVYDAFNSKIAIRLDEDSDIHYYRLCKFKIFWQYVEHLKQIGYKVM